MAANLTWLRAAQPPPVQSAIATKLALNKLKHMASVKSQTLFASSHTTEL